MTRGRRIVAGVLVAPFALALLVGIVGALYGLSASIAAALGVGVWVVAAVAYGVIAAAAAGGVLLLHEPKERRTHGDR